MSERLHDIINSVSPKGMPPKLCFFNHPPCEYDLHYNTFTVPIKGDKPMKIVYELNDAEHFGKLPIGALFRHTASSGDLFEKILAIRNYNALCINSGVLHYFDRSVDVYVIKGKVILEQDLFND